METMKSRFDLKLAQLQKKFTQKQANDLQKIGKLESKLDVLDNKNRILETRLLEEEAKFQNRLRDGISNRIQDNFEVKSGLQE